MLPDVRRPFGSYSALRDGVPVRRGFRWQYDMGNIEAILQQSVLLSWTLRTSDIVGDQFSFSRFATLRKI